MFIYLSIYLFYYHKTCSRHQSISNLWNNCLYMYMCVGVCVRFIKASALYNISNLYLLTFYFIFLLNRYVSALSEYTGKANLQSAVSSGWPDSLHLIKKCISIFYAYWKVSVTGHLIAVLNLIIFILIIKPKTPDSLILQIIISLQVGAVFKHLTLYRACCEIWPHIFCSNSIKY